MPEQTFIPLEGPRWYNPLTWQWRKRVSRFFNSYLFNILGNKTLIIVDDQHLDTAYDDCSVARMVIDRRGEMFSNASFCVKDKTGKEIENHWFLEFFKQPEPMRNREQWLKAYCKYRDIHANVFIKPGLNITDKRPYNLTIIPSQVVQIRTTGEYIRQSKVEDIIESFIVNDAKGQTPYKPKEILYIPDNYEPTKGKGISKILSLKIPISNLVASEMTRNKISVNMGTKMLLSAEVSDKFGASPIKDEQKKEIQKAFAEDNELYSENDNTLKIVSRPVKATNLSYPARDLNLTESDQMDASKIVDAYGLNKFIFSMFQDSTFENYKQGTISCYQNLQPVLDELCGILTERYLKEEGITLVGSYDWLPIMQADQVAEATADKINADMLKVLYESDVIDLEAFAELSEQEFKPIPDAPKNAAQARLRGFVGSATGIIQINQNVAQGFMTPENGIAIIMSLYGYDQPTATSMVTTTKVDMSVPPPSTSIGNSSGQ